MRLLWTEAATHQLESAYLFLVEQSEVAAQTQVRRLLDAVVQLALFPESGRPGRVDGTRELVIQRTPFVVAYRIRADAVRILAVLHGAQRWPSSLP